jgi:hypothetical protein
MVCNCVICYFNCNECVELWNALLVDTIEVFRCTKVMSAAQAWILLSVDFPRVAE